MSASMRYLSQRYSMPDKKVKAALTDIGTEELAHLEMVATIIYQLTRDLSIEEIKASGFDKYYIDHTIGIWPQANLPHYTEIHSPKYGVCVVTHPGIHCGSYIRNADRTINIAESITNAVGRDEYRFLISPDIHNVPFSDKKAFDRYVFCGHVTTNRLNEDHSYNVYVTPYYMDLDCGNGERNRGGKLACYCVDENSAIYV